MQNKRIVPQNIPILSRGFHGCVSISDFERSMKFYEALGFSAEGQMGIEREHFRMQYLFHSECQALI
jgi:hypothetical protein